MMPRNARTTDPLVGSVIDDKYTLEQKLGEGGMSLVYRATHSILNRPVAVKVLRVDEDPSGECAERLEREARTLAQLESPHIVEILDCGTLDSGEPYLVLEHLTGETLAARLGRLGPFGLESACGYVFQAINGLAEAHAKGIVHRDLKPENLFLTTTPAGDDHVKLLDFGISKHVSVTERSGTWKRLTRPQVSVGSPQYMAPEQVVCGPVDTRADVWALGVVLYELTTGELPFDGVSLAEVCARIVQATPDPPSHHNPALPKRFDALVLKCLEKSPALRPAQVTDVAAELRHLLRDRKSQQATTLRLRRPGPARPHRWLVAVFALGAIGPTLLGLPLDGDSAPARESSLLSWPRSAAAEPAAPRPRPSAPPKVVESPRPSPSIDARERPVVETQPRATRLPANTQRDPSARTRRLSRPAVPRASGTDEGADTSTGVAAPAVDAVEPNGLPEFGGRW